MSSAIEDRKIVYDATQIPWQVPFLNDTSSVILLEGGAGGGKSRASGEKIHGYMSLFPGATGLIVRKTRESMVNSTVLFMDKVVIGDDPEVNPHHDHHRWQYSNSSMIVYGGMNDEKQREQIRSIGQDGSLDFAWMEEGTKFIEDDYNELLARMRGKAGPFRQIVISTNPGSPHHWIYKRLIVGGEAKIYRSFAADNPFNPPDYLETLGKIGGTLGLRLNKGLWVQAEGVIYNEYDESLHLIDPFPIPPDWKRFLAIDFGYENPFCCQWWAVDHDGRMYRYREIYWTHKIVSQYASQIKELIKVNRETIPYAVCDHDAEDRATLEASGIRTKPAVKSISPGIQEVIQRIKKAGDGKPRIFFVRNALIDVDPWLLDHNLPTCTEEEITLYSWQRKNDGSAKDTPRDENNHGMDCMRYAAQETKRATISKATAALWQW